MGSLPQHGRVHHHRSRPRAKPRLDAARGRSTPPPTTAPWPNDECIDPSSGRPTLGKRPRGDGTRLESRTASRRRIAQRLLRHHRHPLRGRSAGLSALQAPPCTRAARWRQPAAPTTNNKWATDAIGGRTACYGGGRALLLHDGPGASPAWTAIASPMAANGMRDCTHAKVLRNRYHGMSG